VEGEMQEQSVIMEQMIKLSSEKLELLKQLKDLSEKQYDVLEQHRLDELEGILNRKDEIISIIKKLDDDFLKHSDTLKKLVGIESLTELEKTGIKGCRELKELIGKITSLVEDLIETEKRGYESAVMLQAEFKSEIKNINNARKVTKAYSLKPSSNPSYFIDKKK